VDRSLYEVDRSLYEVDRSFYEVDRSLYEVDRSLYEVDRSLKIYVKIGYSGYDSGKKRFIGYRDPLIHTTHPVPQTLGMCLCNLYICSYER